MIHLFYRRRVRAAVAGLLTGRQELRLRKHIRQCRQCRQEYDQLSLTVEAAGGAVRAQRREAARLNADLDGLAVLQCRPRSVNPRWWPVLLAASAAMLLWAWPAQKHAVHDADEGIAWRGPVSTGSVDEASRFLLLLYSSPIGSEGQAGPVRLAAELPVSQDVSLQLSSYLQLGYTNGLGVRHLIVTLRDARGEVHVLRPEGVEPTLASDRDVHILPGSVSLAHNVAPGPATLCVWLGQQPAPKSLYQRLIEGHCPGIEAGSAAEVAANGFAARLTLVP